MKKNILIGASALILTGTALIGSSIYASSGNTGTGYMRSMGMRSPTAIADSLSGKVSTEALTALTTLMNAHKAEMDAMRSQASTLTPEQKQVKQTEFKAQMDALIAKYPELKTAIPPMGMGGKMGRGHKGEGDMHAIFSSLPTDAQTQIRSIRSNYHTQIDTLREKERSEIDTIIAKYPDIKAKVDALKAERAQFSEGRGNARSTVSGSSN